MPLILLQSVPAWSTTWHKIKKHSPEAVHADPQAVRVSYTPIAAVEGADEGVSEMASFTGGRFLLL